MGKYSQLEAVMGSRPDYNDKTLTGRVLKWYLRPAVGEPFPMPAPERKQMAGEILEQLIKNEVYYVQKVLVRNAIGSSFQDGVGISFQDDDKICVYIDEVK